MNIFVYALTVLFSLTLPLTSLAGTYKDVTMPDQETVNGKKLILNGMGLREVTVMGIDVRVYVAGLYVEKKSEKADEIMAQKFPKRVKMQFLRKVSERDYKKTWREILKTHCEKETLAKSCEEFQNILKEVKSEEVLNYTFDGKGFEIDRAGEKWGRVNSAELANIILSGWIGAKGAKPFDEGLQKGLLGGNKI